MGETKDSVKLKQEINEMAHRIVNKHRQMKKERSERAFAETMQQQFKSQMEAFKKEVADTMGETLKGFNKSVREAARANHLSTFEYEDDDADAGISKGDAASFRERMRYLIHTPADRQENPAIAKRLQRANDVVLVASTVLKRRPSELKYYQQNFSTSELKKAFDTQTAGFGAEWVPDLFSSDFIERMEQRYEVADSIGSKVTIPQGTDSLTIPAMGSAIQLYKISESTADDIDKIPAETPGTRNVKLTPTVFGARVEIPESTLEDSIIPVIEAVTMPELEMAAARTIDNIWINGNINAISEGVSGSWDNNVTLTSDPLTSWDGFRRIALRASATQNQAGAVIDTADLRDLFKQMKNGLQVYYEPERMRLLVSLETYMALVTLADVMRRDGIGEAQMTIDKGVLVQIFGVPIINTQLVKTNLNISGIVDGAGTTTQTIAYHTGAFVQGTKREFTVKSREDIETDRRVLVGTMRVDGKNRFQDTEPVAAYLFNGAV